MPKKAHICIDLGNQTFKMGVFSKKGNKLALLGTLIENTNFNLGDSFKESVPAIAKKISDMLSKLEIKSPSAALYLSLPGPLTFCRLLKLPLVDRTKIHQIVQYEAQQQVPFSLEEVIWNYQILGRLDPEHLHVMLVAVRRELIEDLLKALQQYHLNVSIIEASPLASYHSISPILQAADETVALINIGARSTNLIICEAQTVWIRTIMIGGNYFTEEIQREFKLEFEEAEELKKKKATLENGKTSPEATALDAKLKAVVDLSSKRLMTELTRSLGYYQTQFNNKVITKIYLTGGGSLLQGLDAYLSQKLSVKAEPLNPAELQLIQTSVTTSDNHLLSEVIGLGMHVLKAAHFGINLLPKSYLAEQTLAQKREYIFLAASAAILILISQVLYHSALAKLEQSTLNNVTSTLKEIQTHAQNVKSYTNQTENLVKQDEELKKLVDEKALWIKIFTELQATTPTNIWLDKFKTAYIQKPNFVSKRSKGSPLGVIVLTLFCKTTGIYKDVSDYRDTLQKSPFFHEVQIRSANPPVDGIRDFVIQTEVEE